MKMEVAAAVTTTWLVPHPASSSSHSFAAAVAAAAGVYRSPSLKLVHGARSPAAVRRTVSCASFFSFSPAAAAAVEDCSVTRAFSSTVFIIREVQSFAMRLREAIFNQDLNHLIGYVREELHASFTWLFQCIFSSTPVLMLYLMILLANFTVHSIPRTLPAEAAIVQTSPALQKQSVQVPRKLWILGEEAAVGGGGGRGRHRPVAGSTADGGDDLVFHRRRRLLVDDGEREARLWEAMVEEAAEMSPVMVDHEARQMMVSPVKVELPADDHSDYIRTEFYYQLAVAQEPDNPLLLSNFAQFLYLVLHDHTRYLELVMFSNNTILLLFLSDLDQRLRFHKLF